MLSARIFILDATSFSENRVSTGATIFQNITELLKAAPLEFLHH